MLLRRIGKRTGGLMTGLAIGSAVAALMTASAPSAQAGPGLHERAHRTSASRLAAVAADSSTDAWAVGFTNNCARTMILGWTGFRWKRVPSPL